MYSVFAATLSHTTSTPSLTSYAVFFFTDTTTTQISTLSLHDALPICAALSSNGAPSLSDRVRSLRLGDQRKARSEEHTSELQSHSDLVCRLLLEKKKLTLLCIATQHLDFARCCDLLLKSIHIFISPS